MNVGLIGAGRIGRIHARTIHSHVPGARLARIADVSRRLAAECAEELGIRETTADYREILNDPGIDAVVIASPTDMHAEMVMAAADAGKHIFCEKPLGLDLRKVRAALAAVDRAAVRLQVGFNRRFDHNFSRIRRLVQEGAIGDPHLVRISSRDPAPPSLEYVKVSGGLFLDMTIHDFDMARYLTGSEVQEVYARGAVLVSPEIGKAGDIDTAIVTLVFASGCLGVIDNSRRAAYGYDQRVEVFGSKGSASCANDTASSVVLSTEGGAQGDPPLYFFLERYRQAFIDEMQAFCRAVMDGTPTPVQGIDGVQPLIIGLAAKKSLDQKRPVLVSEIEG
jgi:myo-inositol 2-dehydrogenase / D-chiro-inositol 1-dehydrogenase